MNQTDHSFNQPKGGSDVAMSPTIDIMSLIAVLRTNLWTIVFITATAVVAMFMYLLTVEPTYTASSQMIIDTREQQLLPAEDLVSNLDVSSAVLASEVVTIQSNVLLGTLVDRLDLTNDPEYDPRRERPESFFDAFKRFVRQGEPPHEIARTLPEEVLRSWVIGRVRENLDVSQLGVSNTIGIRYSDQDPVMVAAIANGVAENYIDSQLEIRLAASGRAHNWLAARLEELSVQVEQGDGDVVAFRAEMIEQAKGSEESINQLLAELNKRIVASSTDRADAEVRLSQVEALRKEGGIRAVSEVATSPLLENLNQQRAELAARQAQLASTLGRKHPEMLRITAQLENIDRSVETELERRLEQMRSEAIVTRNREAALQEQISHVSERAGALARASVRLDQLERTANATRLVYENFLLRFKETSARADFQTPQVRIIGRAEVPVVPSAPRRTLMMVAALVMGMSGAIMLVFVRNLLRAPLTTPDEITAITNRPNLAVLPYVPHFGKGYGWLRRELSDNPRTTFLERVKAIRTALLDTDGHSQPPQIIMITSTTPSEGKSVLSCALAKSLCKSRSKLSVVLVDADLRRPDIRSVLGMPHGGPCLLDYLEGNGSLKDLPEHSAAFGIDVVAPSRSTSEAADILNSGKFEQLLGKLTQRYSTVVVNAPPIIYLSDAVVLAKLADKTLLTVKCGHTSGKMIRNALSRFETAGISVDATVLSMVRKTDPAAREAEMFEYSY